MSSLLPLFELPVYNFDLPVSKKKIKVRPYTVKEEKNFLIALQEHNDIAILRAGVALLEACCFNKVNIEELPLADYEALFIFIRSKAVGEELDVYFNCSACSQRSLTSLMLSNIKTSFNDITPYRMFECGNNINLSIKYPTVESMLATSETENDSEYIANCIVNIQNKDSNMEGVDVPKNELVAFIDSLPPKIIHEIKGYLLSAPQLVIDQHMKCPSCGHDNHIHLEGFHNFFA